MQEMHQKFGMFWVELTSPAEGREPLPRGRHTVRGEKVSVLGSILIIPQLFDVVGSPSDPTSSPDQVDSTGNLISIAVRRQFHDGTTRQAIHSQTG